MTMPNNDLRGLTDAQLKEATTCSKCGSPALPGSRFCNTHKPGVGGGLGNTSLTPENDRRIAEEEEDENKPTDFQFLLENTRANIVLKDGIFEQTPDVGQFFASTNINHYHFHHMEHLTPLEKQECIDNIHSLLKDTYKELAKKYDLDFKVTTDKEGKSVFQFINHDGTDLTPEQKRSIQFKLAKDMPEIFNKLSQSLTEQNGLNYRLMMVPRGPAATNENKKDDEEKEENSLTSGYQSPTPFRDPKSLRPKKPTE